MSSTAGVQPRPEWGNDIHVFIEDRDWIIKTARSKRHDMQAVANLMGEARSINILSFEEGQPLGQPASTDLDHLTWKGQRQILEAVQNQIVSASLQRGGVVVTIYTSSDRV